MITNDEILDALKKVFDPELGRSIVELGMVRDLQLSEGVVVTFTLALTIPGLSLIHI
jgi:ATP-binding protein involved in chromosome partitioning